MADPITNLPWDRLAQELRLRPDQVESVTRLLDEGNTVPFITRYRKEVTGNLDEERIREIQHRVSLYRQLAERRQTILRTIESQGKLTDELRAAIEQTESLKRLEDLYLPYKPKKQSLATQARQRGLEPLAVALWNRDEAVNNLDEILEGMIDPEKQLDNTVAVLIGVGHILAERVAEDAEVRSAARAVYWDGVITTVKHEVKPEAKPAEPAPESEHPETETPTEAAPTKEIVVMSPRGGPATREEIEREFRNYFNYSEPVQKIPPHRILAINRGERLGVIKVKIDVDRQRLLDQIYAKLPLEGHPHRDLIEGCAEDALDRLLARSLEREVRNELTDLAEQHAVSVFARNLRNLLLQPPVHERRVLAIDPGYRTGCKYAVLDEIGNLLDHGVVYPYASVQSNKPKKKKKKKKKSPIAVMARASMEGIDESAWSAVQSELGLSSASETEALAKAPLDSPADDELPPPLPTIDELPDDELPPPLPAPGVYRSTSEGGESDPDRPSVEPPMQPAWVGIVVPTPDVIPDETTADLEPSPEPGAEPKPDGPSRRQRAMNELADMCAKHRINVIAIGNGTACRETEELVAEMIAERLPDVTYCIVNEAGASVYSTGRVGREEFPNFDATLRGTISIGRRLLDPLSELVKIDPQSIGVGMYQHDVNPKRLKETLGEVVESCVNYVGVDLNTASVPLLKNVSGLNLLRAKNLVDYRTEHGPFTNREQLLNVPGIGPAVFTQAAGFLKIAGSDQPFDSTWIHPESYLTASKVLELLGVELGSLAERRQTPDFRDTLEKADSAAIAEKVQAGMPTVRDILGDLARPGRDPREDLPKPIFRTGILSLDQLTEGMELKGTVLNVVDFGVFIDVGLKDSGLVHISQLARRFISNPHDVVAVGDIVTTWVLGVDQERRRVSLTMIPPGTPKPQERRGRRDGGRPPRRQPQQQGQPAAPAGVEGQPQQQPPAGGGRDGGRQQGRGRSFDRHDQDRRRPPQARPATAAQGEGAAETPASGASATGSGQTRSAPPRRPGGGPGGGRPGMQRRPGGGQQKKSKEMDRFNKVQGSKSSDASSEADDEADHLKSFGELKDLFDALRKKGKKDKS